MKKIVISIGLLAGATAVYSQGAINWTDYVAPATFGNSGFYIEVFGGGTGGPGNTASDLPAGAATYTGVALGTTGTGSGPAGYGNGANYTVGLYEATTQAGLTTALAGVPIGTANFSAGGGGWDFSGNLDATGVNSGSVWVELAAWYSGGGAATYEAASLIPADPIGTSNAGQLTAAALPGTPSTFANTLGQAGITDFTISPVTTPEPSTIALGVIGASAFLMRLRRKV